MVKSMKSLLKCKEYGGHALEGPLVTLQNVHCSLHTSEVKTLLIDLYVRLTFVQTQTSGNVWLT